MESKINELIDLMDKSQEVDVKVEIMVELFNKIYMERKKFSELVMNNPNDMDLGRVIRQFYQEY
jgi:hypothetical protein